MPSYRCYHLVNNCWSCVPAAYNVKLYAGQINDVLISTSFLIKTVVVVFLLPELASWLALCCPADDGVDDADWAGVCLFDGGDVFRCFLTIVPSRSSSLLLEHDDDVLRFMVGVEDS